jgi:cytochrome c-type biogenesis protein CcmH/NrfF
LLLVHSPHFTTEQSQALVTLLLDVHTYGLSITGIFWGLWLLPMGYLVFRSGFLPKILGILLMVGCFGYLIDSFGAFIFPDAHVSIALFTFWGEVLFPLWLVISGVNVEQWKKRSLESA